MCAREGGLGLVRARGARGRLVGACARQVRKMETQFDSAHSTTFVTFDNVRVPASNLIGDENGGFMVILVCARPPPPIPCARRRGG